MLQIQVGSSQDNLIYLTIVTNPGNCHRWEMFCSSEEIQTDMLLEATHALNGLQRFCFRHICLPKTTPGTTKPKFQGNWSSSNSVLGCKA